MKPSLKSLALILPLVFISKVRLQKDDNMIPKRAEEDQFRPTSATDEVTFDRKQHWPQGKPRPGRRRKSDETDDISDHDDPTLIHCYYCEHIQSKKNPHCVDPIDPEYLVLVQCNGSCSTSTWKSRDGILQYNRTCLTGIPCITEATKTLRRICCHSDECNRTGGRRQPSVALLLAAVTFRHLSIS